MDYIKNLLYLLVGAFIWFMQLTIADFFDITIAEYGNYLFFICALLVFYIILPKRAARYFRISLNLFSIYI